VRPGRRAEIAGQPESEAARLTTQGEMEVRVIAALFNLAGTVVAVIAWLEINR
jgi:hypothetical protein